MYLVRTVVLAVVVALVAVAAASADTSPQTIELLSVQKQFALAPAGAPKLGSRMLFGDAIYNRASQFGKSSSARVGTAEGVCTVAANARAQCTITAHLPNGNLVVVGAFHLSHGLTHSTYAVVGGDGAYAGARGTVDSRDLSSTRTSLEIKLL